MAEAFYISVILPLKLEWEPCYCLTEEIGPETIRTGDRVKVRFANRIYSGVVSATGIQPDTDVSKIKPIETVETSLGRIFPEEIALWRTVAEYYLCTVGEVYKAAYPISKINLEEAHATALLKAQQRRERLLDAMRAKVARLSERLSKKEETARKSREGTKTKARLEEEIFSLTAEVKAAEEALEAAESKSSPCTVYDMKCGASAFSTGTHEEPACKTVSLSKAQELAYSHIKDAFTANRPVLLHGVTGSGKTEIYIKAAQDILTEGKNILYLVPEIALSRQLEDRLHEHFGDSLHVFHSAETAVSRRNTSDAIRYGNGYIVLGTRSSLFLPHHDLGLIIVDEEHDSSYKQDSPAPRYNGRDTALMLSTIHRCRIIMGSATPSLEETYNCMTGKHTLIRLEERYHRSEDSDIEIIDTKAERRKRGMRGSFSIKLIQHINRTLSKGGQVIILRSRRAWSTAMQCSSCGEIVRCPHCNVSLSLHKTGIERMTCHYCGYSTVYTGTCSCGGSLDALGAGTQKIEEEASALFPQARTARLDSDSTQNKTYEAKTIKDFAEGRIDILVGTQIVTKGFDFSGVSLVAVIAADTLLGIQDFRADEKAVQMLEQFRGRCGRRNMKGTLVIQTSQPEHPIYQNIASGTTSELSTNLLQERKDFDFPPFTRIIELTVRDIYEDRCMKMSRRITDALIKGFTDSSTCITGPYSPAIDKVSDQHIRSIRISLRKDRNLTCHKKTLKEIVAAFEKENRYDGHITLNVDPS